MEKFNTDTMVGRGLRPRRVRLGDVCTLSKGAQVNGSELSDTYQYAFLNGGVNPSGRWNASNVSANTVTISEGGNSCGYVNFIEEPFWCGAHCYYLFDLSCDAKYLYHALKARQGAIMGLRTGVCMPNIKKSVITEFELLYHDALPAQREIAAELDRICAMKKNAEERVEICQQLVKSKFVEMFGDPAVNPMRWRVGKVSEMAEYWNGLTYKPENVSDVGTIVLRSSNIQKGRIDLKDVVRVDLNAKSKNLVRAGDILMCSRNGSAALVGKTAIIPSECEKMYFGAFMMVIRTQTPEFLNAFFRTKAFRTQIVCGKTATVNQITCSMMDSVSLPIPPLPLQREFAAYVAKVEKMEAVAREMVTTAEMLYRAKLQEYFG